MIIKFKQTYSENKPGSNCIVAEQIQGNVSSIVYQEKIFEVADVIYDLFFLQ